MTPKRGSSGSRNLERHRRRSAAQSSTLVDGDRGGSGNVFWRASMGMALFDRKATSRANSITCSCLSWATQLPYRLRRPISDRWRFVVDRPDVPVIEGKPSAVAVAGALGTVRRSDHCLLIRTIETLGGDAAAEVDEKRRGDPGRSAAHLLTARLPGASSSRIEAGVW